MTTFLLAHGGAHGAWSWDFVRPELDRLQMRVVAPDVPLEDPSAGLEDCANHVAAALGTADDDVVVVAHSASGAFLPLAAAATGARLMVFLCAVMPLEGSSWVQQLGEDASALAGAPADAVQLDEQGRAVFTQEGARAAFFNDCPPELATWAGEQLRPFAQRVPMDVLPLGSWPAIPAQYVLGTQDQAISPDWSRRVARERLGVEAVELPTGHDPFLSQPELLARTLVRLAGEG